MLHSEPVTKKTKKDGKTERDDIGNCSFQIKNFLIFKQKIPSEGMMPLAGIILTMYLKEKWTLYIIYPSTSAPMDMIRLPKRLMISLANGI
jgi:hypothetical protein